MDNETPNYSKCIDRKGFIVLLSGVPGVGKTTISYELLKRINSFRLIQETDLIREILRGYNEYIEEISSDIKTGTIITKAIQIPDHMKIFTYNYLVELLKLSRSSFVFDAYSKLTCFDQLIKTFIAFHSIVALE